MGRIPDPEFSAQSSESAVDGLFVKQEILAKLKAAEETNAQRIERAKARAAELLKSSKTEAETLLRVAAEEAHRDQEAQVAAERVRLGVERERILQEGAAKETNLRQHYGKNVAGHVKKSVEEIQRLLNA